jgi:MSHA biogenesis protein MshQ
MDNRGVATKLYHEIEYFSGSSGEFVAWLKIPSLSSSVDTVFYMYYGNPSCSNQQFPEKTWDSDFLTVLHMGVPSGNPYDSTGKHETWQVQNGGTLTYHAPGQVGYAIKGEYSDNGGNRFDNFGMDLASLTAVTIEWWFAPDDITRSSYRFGADGYNGQDARSLFSYNSDTQKCGWVETWDDGIVRRLDGRLYNWNNGEFHHGAVIMDNSGSNYHGIYTDGTLTISNSPSDFNFANLNNEYYLGSRSPERGFDSNFDGWLDEFRISKVRRSDDWIITSYNTMNNPSSFFNVGPEESAP